MRGRVERAVSSTRIYDGKVVGLRVDKVSVLGKRLVTREVVEHRGSAAVVPVTAEGDVILVRQFRHAVGEELLEIPAGTLEPGETFERCARRELVEETGYRAGRLKRLASFYLAPGYSSEKMLVFVAQGLKPAKAKPAEGERLRVVKVRLEDCVELIRKGEIRDAKTIAALLWIGTYPYLRHSLSQGVRKASSR